MRFLVPAADRLEQWPEAYRAYIGTADGRVHPTRVEVEDNLLTCRRTASDSGRLHIAWSVPGHGRPVLQTATLPEREEPYFLPLELARGKLGAVRDQAGAWEVAGLSPPEEFAAVHRRALKLLVQASAVLDDAELAGRLAVESLASSLEASDLLVRHYIRQRLVLRRKRSQQLPAALGCDLGEWVPDPIGGHEFCEAFTTACVPVSWRRIEPQEGAYDWTACDAQVEWARRRKVHTFGGPLLDFSPEGLPEWLWQWQHDFYNLQSFASDFVETAIARYTGRIRHWEVCARANTGGALALDEEQRLTLVVRLLEAARHVDQDLQLTLRIDQPWGDYQARGQHQLSPLQFVDALLRSGTALSGVVLELACGFRPRGSAPRDLLDTSRLIDHWGLLGVPIQVVLAVPSAVDDDPHADADLEVEHAEGDAPWSPALQAAWVDDVLPLLMAKQAVTGIFWSHFTDAAWHRFPHAGLVDATGQRKPALDQIVKYRSAYWHAHEEL